MEQDSQQTALERYATSLFGNSGDNIDRLIDSYVELYELPTLDKTFSYPSDEFQPFLEHRNFILLCAYDRSGRFLIINKSKSSLRLLGHDSRLIGRTVDDYSSFCLEETANEIALRYTGGHISDLRPVCKMINRFLHGENLHTQNGIVFLALIDGIIKDKVETYEIEFVSSLPDAMIFQNRDALELAIERRKSLGFFPDPDEIEHAPGKLPGLIHRKIVKPALKKHSSTKIRNAIFRRVGAVRSIIDVSCGDDQTIFALSEEFDPDIVVANDINWQAMRETMTLAKSKNYHILFTNHHICELPFKNKFDVALCKNTIHHIASPKELVNALMVMRRICRRLILVDIEDPLRSRAGRIFNRYYERWLGDGADDHHFLTKNKFKNLVNAAYGDVSVTFEDIWTVKGRYMLADISFDSKVTDPDNSR